MHIEKRRNGYFTKGDFRMKRKKTFALLTAAVVALSLTACGGNSSSASGSSTAGGSSSVATTSYDYSSYTGATIDAIKEKGKLVIGTEAAYAPFEFKNLDGSFAGCDIWLAQQIADALGVELEVMDMAFDGIIPAVQSNQVDLGIAGFTVDEERAKVIDFSDMYQKDDQLLIVKKGNESTYNSKESLAGQKVGAQRTTIQSKLIQSALPDSELFELDTYPELALEVTNGNIAGFVVDGAVGASMVEANDQLAVADFAFSPEEANFGKAVVANQQSDDLTELVNAVIANVLADGSFEAAYEEAKVQATELGI